MQPKTDAVGHTIIADSTSACSKEDSVISTIGRIRFPTADVIGG